MRTMTVALAAVFVLAVPAAALAGPAVLAKIDAKANADGAKGGGSARAGDADVAGDTALDVPALPVEVPVELDVVELPETQVDAEASATVEATLGDVPVETPDLPDASDLETLQVDVPATDVGALDVGPPELDAGLPVEPCLCEETHPARALFAQLRANLMALFGP